MEFPLKTKHYLQYVGYYRLSGYMYPFLEQPKEKHQYKPGTSFEQVMRLYRFDKKLRLLLFNEIAKIEVAVRSRVVSVGCEMLGNPFLDVGSQQFCKSRHSQEDTRFDRERISQLTRGIYSAFPQHLFFAFPSSVDDGRDFAFWRADETL